MGISGFIFVDFSRNKSGGILFFVLNFNSMLCVCLGCFDWNIEFSWPVNGGKSSGI